MRTICNTIRISLLFTLVVYLCGAKKGTALKSCCEGTDYRVHIHFMCAVTLNKFLYTLFCDSVLLWPLKEDGHYIVGLYNFKPCMLCPLGTEVAGLVTPRLAHRQFSHILHPRALSERYGGAAGKIRHHFYSRPFHNTSPHPDRERSIRSILYSLEFSRIN